MTKIYQKYIFKNLTVNFLVIASFFIVMIWFTRLISFVKYITENGVEISKVLKLFILILPQILIFIIPISLLLSIIITYNRFYSRNEFVILRNSGLTNFKIATPAIILSILLSLFCYYLAMDMMPNFNKQIRLFRFEIFSSYSKLKINPQTFEKFNNVTIYSKYRNQDNILQGILVSDERSSNKLITITAKYGKIKIEDSQILLEMEQGTAQQFYYKNLRSDILYFDKYILNLSNNNDTDNKINWKVQEMTISELLSYQETTDEKNIKKYQAEIHQRLTYPLFSLIISLIATSSMLSGSFNRKKTLLKNILLASILSALFIIISLVAIDLIIKNPSFFIIIYINIVIFSTIAIIGLQENLSKLIRKDQ